MIRSITSKANATDTCMYSCESNDLCLVWDIPVFCFLCIHARTARK